MKFPNTTHSPSARDRKIASEASMNKHTDSQLAHALARATRQDVNLGQLQFAGRDRILKLSCELWDARQRIAELEAELQQVSA